jgi:hypothetical protein
MVRDERIDWTKTEDMEMHEVWAPDCAHDSDYTVLVLGVISVRFVDSHPVDQSTVGSKAATYRQPVNKCEYSDLARGFVTVTTQNRTLPRLLRALYTRVL